MATTRTPSRPRAQTRSTAGTQKTVASGTAKGGNGTAKGAKPTTATAKPATATAKPATATAKPATATAKPAVSLTKAVKTITKSSATATVRAAIKDLDAAWAVTAPTGDMWTPRPWVPTLQRQEEGRAERKRVPRTSHAAFEMAKDRDPIAILTSQETDRLEGLVPLRHARMAESPFAYYRGTPAVMAFDLSTTPRTDILVQASGDAHLSNFGIYASPERHIVFDANDFDETLPAPWEWDVKRLAASVVIAGRSNRFSAAKNRTAAMATVASYRDWMARFAVMRLIDIWYSGVTEESIRTSAENAFAKFADVDTKRAKLDAIFAQARGRDVLKATAKLTTVVDGKLTIKEDPPVVERVEIPGGGATLAAVFDAYRATMSDSLREFLERYRFSDYALKVVGVGSVGTRCFMIVLQGRDEGDPLILQAKEATESVLEPFAGKSQHPNHAQRVVHGQQLMQASSDIFLGWCSGPGGRDFYFRQLWDMKGSVDVAQLLPEGLAFYGGLCARALAAAHARTGDAVAIAAYMGSSDTFDGAIADFSETYADQNERDHAAFVAAIADGRVKTSA